jgi:hypothetical protein
MFLESFFPTHPIPMKTPSPVKTSRKEASRHRREIRSRQRKEHNLLWLLREIKRRLAEYCASRPHLTWGLFARPFEGLPPFALNFRGDRMPDDLRASIVGFKDSLARGLKLLLKPHPKTSDNRMVFSVAFV